MTQSRLTIGTPKIPAKPPRGKPPCREPIVYGANILKDPGVELQLANFGGGPLGNEIPQFVGVPVTGLRWSDHTAGPSKSYFIQDQLAINETVRWHVSTANPRSGTYHLRLSDTTNDAHPWVQLGQANGCPAGLPFYTAVVQPGDFVKWSMWAMASSTAILPIFSFYVLFMDAAYSYIGPFFQGADDTPLPSSYTQFSVEGFVPATAAYAELWIYGVGQDDNTATATHYDFDDFVLEVQD